MKEGVVYSGSFNPFHIGHMETVEYLSKRFEFVILVVSIQNPLKTFDSDNFNERFNNVKEIINKKGLKNVIVEDIEKTLSPPYYTINTLYSLEEKYPDMLLSYCIGSDCLYTFDKWYDWESIITYNGLVVIPRKGYPYKEAIVELKTKAKSQDFWHLVVLDADITEISSSEIREKIKNGETVSHLLP